MFCYQCQETKGNSGCDIGGVCGKSSQTSDLQDALLQITKKVAYLAEKSPKKYPNLPSILAESLFVTVTNVNFDNNRIEKYINKLSQIIVELGGEGKPTLSLDQMLEIGGRHGVLSTTHEDTRSLKELLIYGLKGVAAYAHHAYILGYNDKGFDEFLQKILSYLYEENFEKDKLLALVMECGKHACSVMATLDYAHRVTFGKQSPVNVQRGVKDGFSILVSGHDLQDLHELLKQTEGKGINVYTHGEMLTAHAYPILNKFKHLAGHFGSAWHNQQKELAGFSGVILFTTNCIQKPLPSYIDRVWTTGATGYEGCPHIDDRAKGVAKNFSPLIETVMKTQPMKASNEGSFLIGFGKDSLLGAADKVIEAVKSGDISKFVVMAGCDGRHKDRQYFTDIASKLPKSAVILTAGCGKYRYNHLDLGDINGIPRLLDAGQCNDSYSLAFIAMELQKAFGLDDINKLPIAFDIGWYEQKAVAVLLALLHLGFKNIRLGTTLPAFLSPNVAEFLVTQFGIKQTGDVEEDLRNIIGQ